MSTPEIVFRRNAVEPVECIKSAWNLIKDRYWLFVGICAVGLLIGSAVPLGILMGPMMCGFYLSCFQLRRGQHVEFATLFKGFDYFGASIIATLLHIIPILVVIVPAYILFYVGILMTTVASQGDEPNPGAFLGIFVMFALFWIVVMIVIIFISIGFSFSYPLIVDRKLAGLDAIKLSFRAAISNFWRLLGMMLLTTLLTLGGLMLCYVGMFLVFPIVYGAIAVAYEQVFGLSNPNEMVSNLPPPPPRF